MARKATSDTGWLIWAGHEYGSLRNSRKMLGALRTQLWCSYTWPIVVDITKHSSKFEMNGRHAPTAALAQRAQRISVILPVVQNAEFARINLVLDRHTDQEETGSGNNIRDPSGEGIFQMSSAFLRV